MLEERSAGVRTREAGAVVLSGPFDRPLRILAYNWRDLAHPRAGGAEVHLQSVAREWVKWGHQVTIFCAAVEGRPAREIVDGVEIIRRGETFSVYREARRFWRREGQGHYDLVFDDVNTRPFLCPRFIKDTPVVAIIHQLAKEVWRYEMPWPVAILGRYVLEPRWLRTYRDVPVVTMCESGKESLVDYGLRRVTPVPTGFGGSVTADLDAVTTDRPVIAKENVPTVIFLGRLSANKRPDHAVRAFALVRRELPDAQMWVVGSGPEQDRLRKIAGPGVTIFGRLPEQEKRERLSRAHALLVTSVREGWGLVVTEAAACGTVTVGYDVSGLRDSVRVSGGVLTPADPESLADELTQLLPALVAGMGPHPEPAGVLPWPEVAAGVLAAARQAGVP